MRQETTIGGGDEFNKETNIVFWWILFSVGARLMLRARRERRPWVAARSSGGRPVTPQVIYASRRRRGALVTRDAGPTQEQPAERVRRERRPVAEGIVHTARARPVHSACTLGDTPSGQHAVRHPG